MQIYQTQDSGLAITLATCGVQFPRNEKGEIIPLYNFYTAEILRGYGYRGMPIMEAARLAWLTGKRGRVTYNFIRDALCDRVLNTYKGQSKAITEAADAGLREMSATVTPEQIAAVCCQFAVNRKWLVETAWRKTIPCVEIPGPVRTEREGEKIITIGSVKAISLNASPELRAAIGV